MTPDEPDWAAGDWETISATSTYLARVLVGDDTTVFPLVIGTTYDAWLRITDTPERPARLTGQILGT